MDSNKIALIIGGILIAGFLALPLLNKMKEGAGSGAEKPAAESAPAGPPPAVGPDLTQADLNNSVWQGIAEVGGMKVEIQVELKASGQFVATPTSAVIASMMSGRYGVTQLTGSWTVAGKDLNLSGRIGNDNVNVSAKIHGQTVLIGDKPATRVR